VDGDDLPVSDVWVTASALTHDLDRPPFLREMVEPVARALTGPEGRFVLDGLTGGDTEYTVHVEQPSGGSAIKTGIRVGDPDVSILLPAPGTLAGTVVGGCGSGTPVRVQAVNSETGQSRSQDLPGPGSPFSISVAPGRVRLTAFCRGGGGVSATDNRDIAKRKCYGPAVGAKSAVRC